MKTIYIITLSLLLSACAILNPPKFDSAEYSALVDIRLFAEHPGACDTYESQITISKAIDVKADWAVKYSEFLVSNKNVNAMLTILKQETGSLLEKVKQGQVSTTYCETKLNIIKTQSTMIQKTLGKLQ